MNPRASAFVAISENRTRRIAHVANAARVVSLLDEQPVDAIEIDRAPMARLILFASSISALFRR
jgi:uncharacterized membrane protein